LKEYPAKRMLTAKLRVEGKNLSSFLTRIARGGVTVLEAKPEEFGLNLTVPYADCKKLFAICDNMCYNIIIDNNTRPKNHRKSRPTVRFLRRGGVMKTLHGAVTRVGIIAGLALFIAFAVWLDGTLLGYSLEKVPTECRGGVVRTLKENGAVKHKRFSALDTDALATAIVRENPSVGFATVYKRGSFLVVEALSVRDHGYGNTAEDMIAPQDGEIVRIVVLRGTPLVAAGERVKAGQPLVGAYFTVGEERVSVSPVAEVYFKADFTLSFNVSGQGQYYNSAALAVTKEKCPETNIIDQKIVEEPTADGYKITVTLTFVKKLGG